MEIKSEEIAFLKLTFNTWYKKIGKISQKISKKISFS
jgi:hypothetical protein